MSFLFLIYALFVGWTGWNLSHPAFNNGRLAFVSFAAGLPAAELAPHIIFWQAIGLGFFALFGGVWGIFGVIGLALCIYAWGTMAMKYYHGSRIAPLVHDALVQGLGEGYEEEIKSEFRNRFVSEPSTQLIRHPFRHKDPDVETIKNISYGDFRQRLDIKRRQNSDTGLLDKDQLKPVLLHIHGGAWTIGKKDDGQAVPLMNTMAKQDWICVSVSYRLSPDATFPDHIIDCKQALVWIKEHIAEYGGDPDFIAVTGGSAGGHLSSLVALSPNYAPFQPGFENKDTTVQAAVPFYGIYDFADRDQLFPNDSFSVLLEDSVMKLDFVGNEDLYDEASPVHHLTETAPPMFVIQGTLDSLVPVEMAREFVASLRETSTQKSVYLEVPGAQHAFDLLPSPRSELVKFGVEKFLTWTYSQHLKSD
ncbi:MAG: acetyl esterase/lipase [Candidatus Azotimanducaceae bacterium]|jgi:acetyl esterase/lipase